MKIGICCYPSYGGSGVVATELGINLAKRGHEVHFITYDKPFRLTEYVPNVFFHGFEAPNYPVFKHPPYIMALANKIYEVAKRESLDILHAHYAVPHATAVYLAKQMLEGQVKTLTTLHGTDVTIISDDPGLNDITSFSLKQCDAITAVSHDLQYQAEEILGLKDSIHMIYNFVDLEEYSNKPSVCIKEFLKLVEDEKVVIHISNFRPVKRIQDVMAIFKKINEEVPSRLVLVGDGPDIRMAYDLTEEYQLRDRVHFLGKQECVVGLISNSDLFLLPSEKESFGLAALEAMACEVPVIASKAGGIPEVVIDGETGFLSSVGDVDKMASDAIRLLKDPELHKSFANASRQRAVDVFNEQEIVNQYIQLYEKLLAK